MASTPRHRQSSSVIIRNHRHSAGKAWSDAVRSCGGPPQTTRHVYICAHNPTLASTVIEMPAMNNKRSMGVIAPPPTCLWIAGAGVRRQLTGGEPRRARLARSKNDRRNRALSTPQAVNHTSPHGMVSFGSRRDFTLAIRFSCAFFVRFLRARICDRHDADSGDKLAPPARRVTGQSYTPSHTLCIRTAAPCCRLCPASQARSRVRLLGRQAMLLDKSHWVRPAA